MRSSSTDFAITCDGFCIRVFKTAYSVLVKFTPCCPAKTSCVVMSSRRLSKDKMESVETTLPRSATVILASSSFISKGFVI